MEVESLDTLKKGGGNIRDIENYTVVTEGKASILFSKGNEVFYNPVQEVNRDLSIMMIKLFQEDWEKGDQAAPSKSKKQKEEPKQNSELTILEALSATGLRSIRYAKELKGVKNIVANDIDQAAVAAIRKNVEYNGVDPSLVTPNHSDASMFMYQHRDPEKRFTVVDIDPYGGADPFLDSAVQSVKDGGLLCVTCTDLAVLCGNHSEVCWSKYGSLSLHEKYCHEMAIRIVLASVESHAARYKRYIVPLLSLQIDFYVRLFVRVYTSASETKKSPTKLSQVYQCTGCDSFWLQPMCKGTETKNGNFKFTPSLLAIDFSKCTQCGHSLKIGGPIYAKPIHNPEWVTRLLSHISDSPQAYNQSKKITGMLNAVKDEIHDVPLFYALNALSNTLHVTTPSMVQFRSALIHKGYRVSNSHCNPNAVKTDAPNEVVWDIMRGWCKLHPPKNQSPSSAGSVILAKEPSFEADFATHQGAAPSKVPKFHPNPANWGPGSRAGRKRSSANSSDESNPEKRPKGEEGASSETKEKC